MIVTEGAPRKSAAPVLSVMLSMLVLSFLTLSSRPGVPDPAGADIGTPRAAKGEVEESERPPEKKDLNARAQPTTRDDTL